MKLSGCMGVILAAAFMQGVVAQANLDTLWLCRDSIEEGSPAQLWFRMYLADTFPDNRGAFKAVDTGASQDGSPYVNFDYQFNNDSVHCKGKTITGTDTIYTSGPRPGYAGFKFYWDDGNVKYYADQHDSMVLWHKGPLPGHKVQMIWAQGGECGGPINYQYFGEYKSSTEWKRECFPFPLTRENSLQNPFPDSPFVKRGLFELRMLISNDSSITTSPTSEKGCLKLDNICFIKKNAAGVNERSKLLPGAAAGPDVFIPKVSGKVLLTIYSLQGEQLFKDLVDVTAGKKYEVSRFALNNSKLPARWIHCVQVSGAGVNITAKVFR